MELDEMKLGIIILGTVKFNLKTSQIICLLVWCDRYVRTFFMAVEKTKLKLTL